MRRHFEEVEEELKDRLLQMMGDVEEMVHQAVQALVERKPELWDSVQATEENVNRMQIELDDRCMKLIALHQPAATDLRFILAASKINADLERIADQAVNIMDHSRAIIEDPSHDRLLFNIPNMADLAMSMLKDSLDAFVKKDESLARDVVKRDDREDQMKEDAFTDLVKRMESDPSSIRRSLSLILISRHLERIADHSTNIAENVIFMITAKDIRHHAADAQEEK